jgi:hypothetical protein
VSVPKIDFHQLQTSVAVHKFIVEETATLCPDRSGPPWQLKELR